MTMSSTADGLRVVLLDQHALIRGALRMLLEAQPHFTIVGEAVPGPEAVALVAQHQPDLILLNLLLQAHALELIPLLLTAAAQTRLVVVTAPHDDPVRRQAMHLGALGVVHTDHPPAVVVEALTKVHGGEVWADRQLLARVLTERVRAALPTDRDPELVKSAMLTEREREIIALVATGLRSQEMAQRLGLAESTVRHHLTAIFAKLGVTGRAELIVYAYRYGLATPPL
jgi:DNA-binding NarL/FixJ family response regulator